MKNVVLMCNRCAGDITVLTALVRDIHKCYPGEFKTDVRIHSRNRDLWQNNPYITPLDHNHKDVTAYQVSYKIINKANRRPIHFMEGMMNDFNEHFKVNVHPTAYKGDIHLSEGEKKSRGLIHEMLKEDVPYWIINAGCKSDMTNKLWEKERFNKLIKMFPEVYFVQTGALHEGKIKHFHEPLKGPNVIDLLGKTSMRDMVNLMYHACGVISGISFPVHLAAAVPMHPKYKRYLRPCITLAGGRESTDWARYPGHAFIDKVGRLPCCSGGGCWMARVEAYPDGDDKRNGKLCRAPVVTESGQKLPLCMDMIPVDEVAYHIRQYMQPFNWYADWGYKKPAVN